MRVPSITPPVYAFNDGESHSDLLRTTSGSLAQLACASLTGLKAGTRSHSILFRRMLFSFFDVVR